MHAVRVEGTLHLIALACSDPNLDQAVGIERRPRFGMNGEGAALRRDPARDVAWKKDNDLFDVERIALGLLAWAIPPGAIGICVHNTGAVEFLFDGEIERDEGAQAPIQATGREAMVLSE